MRRLLPLAVSSAALVFMGLASLPSDASAEATFQLGLSGPGTVIPSGFECSPICKPKSFWWSGPVTLVTSSDADGVYSGPGSFISLSIQTNLLSVTSPGLNFAVGDGTPTEGSFASVTIANGQVTSFGFIYVLLGEPDFEEVVEFGGLAATYSQSGGHHGPIIEASAVLTNVPEPETLSLMLAGLVAGLAVRSRTRNRPVRVNLPLVNL